MDKIFLIFFSIVITGCLKNKVKLKDLKINNGIYHISRSNEPYSGHAYSYFKEGGMSNDIYIKEGIPSGKWMAYGYDGEIVQSGEFNPLLVDQITILDVTAIDRINVCFTKEGDYKFIDVFIISNTLQKVVDKAGDKEFRSALLEVLRSNNVKIDTKKINEIVAGNGELQ